MTLIIPYVLVPPGKLDVSEDQSNGTLKMEFDLNGRVLLTLWK